MEAVTDKLLSLKLELAERIQQVEQKVDLFSCRLNRLEKSTCQANGEQVFNV